jgi:hypothetical protein
MSKSSEILWRFEARPPGGASLTDDDRGVLDDELDEMLDAVASCATFEAAEPFLEELDRLQLTIATLAFKHSARLSARQREIVSDFDRCDLSDVRRKTFRRIKHAEFPWCRVRE